MYFCQLSGCLSKCPLFCGCEVGNKVCSHWIALSVQRLLCIVPQLQRYYLGVTFPMKEVFFILWCRSSVATLRIRENRNRFLLQSMKKYDMKKGKYLIQTQRKPQYFKERYCAQKRQVHGDEVGLNQLYGSSIAVLLRDYAILYCF